MGRSVAADDRRLHDCRWLNRSHLGRRLGLGVGVRGWLFTLAVMVAPVPLLFHEPFITRVVIPLLQAIGAVS